MKKFIKLILCCLFLSFGLFADHDQFGLNTNNFPSEPQQYEGSPQRLYFEQLNIQWIRGGIDWKDIEKDPVNKPGQYEFVETGLDQMVAYAHDNNINLIFNLGATPFEYRRLGVLYFDYINPIHVDKWTAFVTAMVNRYKSVIKYWEIWNEPNLYNSANNWETNADQFVDLILVPGIAAISTADPTAEICGPNLSSANNPIPWFNFITSRGVVFNVLTHHQYDGGNTALGRFNALKEFHDNADNMGYSGKPFWLTETGWPVDNSLGNAAYNMGQMLDYMLANKGWWNKTFWFAYRDTNDYMPLIDYQTDEPYPQYYTFKSYTNPPANPSSVTVEVPNGGESWACGGTYSIQYNMFPDSNVKIELMKGGALDHIIINTTPGELGFYDWTIPSDQAPGSNYKIRITNYYDNTSDSSDADFSIIDGGLPDVVITDIWLEPADPLPGQNVNVWARITNQGNAPTPSGVYVGVGFKIDNTYLGAFFVMNGSNFSSLAAGASYTAACGTQWTATAGAHNVWVTADDMNRFPESNENNNIGGKSINVQ